MCNNYTGNVPQYSLNLNNKKQGLPIIIFNIVGGNYVNTIIYDLHHNDFIGKNKSSML